MIDGNPVENNDQEKREFLTFLKMLVDKDLVASNAQISDHFDNMPAIQPRKSILSPSATKKIGAIDFGEAFNRQLRTLTKSDEIVDDEICLALCQIILDDDISESSGLKAAECLSEVDWSKASPETASSLANYLVYALEQELGDDFDIHFLRTIGNIVDTNFFDKEGGKELPLSKILVDRLKKDLGHLPRSDKDTYRVFIFDIKLRIETAKALAKTKHPTEEIIKLIISTIKSYEKMVALGCDKNKELEMVDALVQALANFITINPAFLALIQQEIGFDALPQEVKRKFVIHFPIEALSQLSKEADELLRVYQEERQRDRLWKGVHQAVDAFKAGRFEEIVPHLEQVQATNQQFIDSFIATMGHQKVAFPLLECTKNLLNNLGREFLSAEQLQRLETLCQTRAEEYSADNPHVAESWEARFLLNPQNPVVKSYFEEHWTHDWVSSILSEAPVNPKIIESLQNVEALIDIIKLGGPFPYLINLCRHNEYRDLILVAIREIIKEYKELCRLAVPRANTKFKIFVFYNMYELLANINLMGIPADDIIIRFALDNFPPRFSQASFMAGIHFSPTDDLNINLFIKKQMGKRPELFMTIIPRIMFDIFYGDLPTAVRAASLLEMSNDKGLVYALVLMTKLMESASDSLSKVEHNFAEVVVGLIKYPTEAPTLLSVLHQYSTSDNIHELQASIIQESVTRLLQYYPNAEISAEVKEIAERENTVVPQTWIERRADFIARMRLREATEQRIGANVLNHQTELRVQQTGLAAPAVVFTDTGNTVALARNPVVVASALPIPASAAERPAH